MVSHSLVAVLQRAEVEEAAATLLVAITKIRIIRVLAVVVGCRATLGAPIRAAYRALTPRMRSPRLKPPLYAPRVEEPTAAKAAMSSRRAVCT